MNEIRRTFELRRAMLFQALGDGLLQFFVRIDTNLWRFSDGGHFVFAEVESCRGEGNLRPPMTRFELTLLARFHLCAGRHQRQSFRPSKRQIEWREMFAADLGEPRAALAHEFHSVPSAGDYVAVIFQLQMEFVARV